MKQNTKLKTKKTKKNTKNTKIKKNTRLRKRTYKKVKNMRKNKKGGGEKRGRDEEDYDHEYDDDLNEIDFENVQRNSRSNNLIVTTKTLGNANQSSYTSNIDFASDDDLREFVDEIADGPQIVSIPVPSFRHAFLVNVLPKNKIMISDWRGNEKLKNINRRAQRGQADWNQYYDFIELLEQKYKLPIKFYIVNQGLFKIAFDKNGYLGGGGCSEYIYSWVEGVLNKDKTFFSR